MATIIRRILAAMVTAIVAFLGIVGGAKTGNYSPLLALIPCGLFWFIELQFRPGIAAYTIQYFFIRVASASIISGMGAFLIYLGVSELSEPVAFTRFSYRVISDAIRHLLGSEGLAVLLFLAGVFFMIAGIRMFFQKPKVRESK